MSYDQLKYEKPQGFCQHCWENKIDTIYDYCAECIDYNCLMIRVGLNYKAGDKHEISGIVYTQNFIDVCDLLKWSLSSGDGREKLRQEYNEFKRRIENEKS